MAVQTRFTWKTVGIDKKPLQKIIEEQNRIIGLPAHPKPTMTPQQLRERMIAAGVRPGVPEGERPARE